MSEIAICWWCDGTEVRVSTSYVRPVRWQVQCLHCGAESPAHYDKDLVVAVWNVGPKVVSIVRDILAADERGQGQSFADAMDRAHKAISESDNAR